MRGLVWLAALTLSVPCAAQTPEKELVLTITGPQLRSGVVSEVTWDGGTLVIQGVFADPSGKLAAQYFAKPADQTTLQNWREHSAASLQYWETKSNRRSPTGLGSISLVSDTKLPMYGIGSLAQRMGDAVNMGGTITTHVFKLHGLTLHERISAVAPYDGEIWSWSPLELNRIAYVDGKGDLWVAHADGRSPRRIARGDFTLPAWSGDGRVIAVAERKSDRWEISVIHLPAWAGADRQLLEQDGERSPVLGTSRRGATQGRLGLVREFYPDRQRPHRVSRPVSALHRQTDPLT